MREPSGTGSKTPTGRRLRPPGERNLAVAEDLTRLVATAAIAIVHDLRNLLLAARLDIERLDDGAGRAPVVHDDLAPAMAALDAGMDLTGRLLDLTRAAEEPTEALDPALVIEESRPLLDIFGRRGRSLAYDLQRGTCCRLARPLFVAGLVNLVLNAQKAAPGTRIALRVRPRRLEQDRRAPPFLRRGPYAEIAVSDDGPGMDREVRRRAFQPFFSASGGHGLGLTGLIDVARLAGGQVTAASRAGVGARIVLLLPDLSRTSARSPEA